MMKINYKIFTVIAITSVMFFSCDDGDALIDGIDADTTRGAILRTLDITSNELPIGVSDGFFGVDLEVQSEELGGLVDAVEVFATYVDQTPDNGKGATSTEAMIESVAKSSFGVADSGYPLLSYTASLGTLLSTTGVAEADIDGGDQFLVRFEILMNDGRRFSFADNTGTLTGAFINSPFQYNATIVCPPTPPADGDWIFDMTDAYGDGWNGASLLVTIDGVATNLEAMGAGSNVAFPVPAGTQAISIQFVSGNWDGEIGFTVTSANGNVILTQEAYTTNATAGVELINYCVKNF